MTVNKIDTEQLAAQRRFHSQQEDVPGMSALDMKAFFDYISKEKIIPKLNEVIDALGEVYSKTETELLLSQKPNADAVYTKTETDLLLSQKPNADAVYTKADTDAMLLQNQNAVNQGFCNAVNGVAEGDSVAVTDASPVPHGVNVQLHSKNRVDITKAYLNKDFKSFLTNLTTDNNVLRFEKAFDGSVSAGVSVDVYLEAGKYIFSGESTTNGDGNMAYTIIGKNSGQLGGTVTIGKNYQQFVNVINIPKSDIYTFTLYIGYSAANGSYVSYSNLMLEKSNVKTEYVPFVNVAGASFTKTANGTAESYTTNENGFFSGVVSAPEFDITPQSANVQVKVTYNRDINKVIEQLLNQ